MKQIRIAFPILIYDELLCKDNPIQHFITEFISNNKVERNDCWPEYIKTTFGYNGNNNFLNDDVKMFIEHKANQYVLEAFNQYTSYAIHNSWLNLYEFKDYQYDHNHLGEASTNITCVYYHSTNILGGEIVFRNPSIISSNTFTSFETYIIKPQNYQLLFFPSFLIHRVNPNQSSNIRVSLSCNLNIKNETIK